MILVIGHALSAPDLPASLTDQKRLQSECARQVAQIGGGLIEAAVGEVDYAPALWRLFKMPLPDASKGQFFSATWTIPKARCCTTLTIQAAESRPTGLRETQVALQVGLNNATLPHPYAGGEQLGGLPYLVADEERWDGQFPQHPLTLVRAELKRLTSTITLADDFKALPPFTGPDAPPAGYTKR